MRTKNTTDKTATDAPEAPPTLSTRETINLVKKAFYALAPLDNIDWNSHREKLFQLCRDEEKNHRGFMCGFRESHTSDTASVNEAARLFAVKRIAEYLQNERMPQGKEHLHIQTSCFYAAGIVDEFRERIEKLWADFDIPALANLDYCQIVKVKS